MTAPAESALRGSRWRTLLIGSLAINLLVAGAVAGAIIQHRRLGGPGPDLLNVGRMVGEPGLRSFVRTLPEERRKVLRTSVEQIRVTLKPLRQTVRQARLESLAALKSDPFDAPRFEKAMGDLIEAEAKARRAGVAILTRAVSQMTPAERELFQSWRVKQMRNGPPPVLEPVDAAPPPAPSNTQQPR
jgi:uncharacterized membrane protein